MDASDAPSGSFRDHEAAACGQLQHLVRLVPNLLDQLVPEQLLGGHPVVVLGVI